MKIIQTILLGIIFAISTNISANDDETIPMFFHGNKLYEHLTGTEFEQALAMVYIAGVVDQYFNMHSQFNSKPKACLSRNVSNAQLADVVKKFLKEQPEIRQYVASDIVTLALEINFPCKK
jgi:hypothetical protein